jgi:prevent-host-death family protein
MDKLLNAKELRATLPSIVERVQRGERFTVLYRSRPAFRIVPAEDDAAALAGDDLSSEPLYRAGALGQSSDGLDSADHDALLYDSAPRSPTSVKPAPKRARR